MSEQGGAVGHADTIAEAIARGGLIGDLAQLALAVRHQLQGILPSDVMVNRVEAKKDAGERVLRLYVELVMPLDSKGGES